GGLCPDSPIGQSSSGHKTWAARRRRTPGEKGTGTVVRSTLRAVPATVPVPFSPMRPVGNRYSSCEENNGDEAETCSSPGARPGRARSHRGSGSGLALRGVCLPGPVLLRRTMLCADRPLQDLLPNGLGGPVLRLLSPRLSHRHEGVPLHRL